MHATHDDSSIPNGNRDFRSKACAELTIGDLLADPLTGALMRADRVDMDDFHEMLRSVDPPPPGGSDPGATDGEIYRGTPNPIRRSRSSE